MFFVFPTFVSALHVMRCVILFKRGHIKDIEVSLGGPLGYVLAGREGADTLPAASLQGFNKWLDQQMANSPQPALSVYPEGALAAAAQRLRRNACRGLTRATLPPLCANAAGHRSVHGRSLPLKRGLIKYAYTRRLPVQIVIGANKESILSEKHHTARFGQTAAVGYSGGGGVLPRCQPRAKQARRGDWGCGRVPLNPAVTVPPPAAPCQR